MAVSMIKTKNPFDLLTNLPEYVRTVNRLFAEPEDDQEWVPSVDVNEKDGNYFLRIDLPGVREEDILIAYSNGYLTIKGTRQRDNGADNESNLMQERYFGHFKRVLRFPPGVNEAEIMKQYKNGILEITIPAPDVNSYEKKTTK